MPEVASAAPTEHLTPHDLIAYFHCPHEMELTRAEHSAHVLGTPIAPRTPEHVVPLRHSPLFTPPLSSIEVVPGRLDLGPDDLLVYEDEGEDDLPVLFPPERVRKDPRFTTRPGTLHDPELNFAGRPDLVIARRGGELVPLEYKTTHLYTGYHDAHGRLFDTVQAIAECRLVEAAFGRRPPYAIVLYGDLAGDGTHEGWVKIPYTDADVHWLRAALIQVRTDSERAPVPAERNCGGCEPNALGLCRFAAARYEGPHHRTNWHPSPRPDLSAALRVPSLK
ncbi:MAG: CRISPR-associated protein Cas4 [Thermoplasmata archaeon]